MKFRPLLGTDLSGSLGGIVASHNRGGPYFRNRAIPVDPGSVFQLVIRGFVSALTSLWLNTLTPAQRAAWDLYALNVLLPDPLGDPRNVGGLNMYTRSNVPRLQAALPRVDAAPTVFNLGDYTNPVVGSPTEAGQTVPITFTPADDWANEDDAGMTVQISRPQNPSINFFKGPYRFGNVILGDSAIPPVSPANVVAPFAFVAGQRLFVEAKVTRADGRLSATFRSFGLAIA